MSKEPIYLAKVESILKSCSAGHKVGDEFEINTHKTGGICGYCYHDLFPTLMNMCYERFHGKIMRNLHTNALTAIILSHSM